MVTSSCSTIETARRPTPLNSSANFAIEAEKPGHVVFENDVLDIDVPAGCTLWYRHQLHGRVRIDFDAVAVSKGGPNDRVSDLNCFWMASDPAAPGSCPFARPRGGRFADYDTLKTYYVGIGGNGNTTTRFRRYVGERDNRPLLPQHDLRDASHLLLANQTTHVTLTADASDIQVLRDGKRLFRFADSSPYTTGYVAFRTVDSHLKVSNLCIRSD